MTMTIDAVCDSKTLASTWNALGVALRAALLGLMVAAAPAFAQSGGSAPAPSETEAEVQFSEAENLLWMTDQLRAVTAPSVITYSFVKDGSYEEGFEDSIEFTISKVHADGMKAASIRFFTGQRNFPVPSVDSTDVNPVLKVYFQGDVYEMNRLTDPDGKSKERWRYFQRRIKFALAEAAKVTDTEVEFDGKKYKAKEIFFEPYVNDPKRSQFEKFATKRYSVIVADDLPGYVYEVRTEVPGEEGAGPLLRERLQIQSVRAFDPTSATSSRDAGNDQKSK
jgi:hypothetical protein